MKQLFGKQTQSKIAIAVVLLLAFGFTYSYLSALSREYVTPLTEMSELENTTNRILYFHAPLIPDEYEFDSLLKDIARTKKTPVYKVNPEYFMNTFPKDEVQALFDIYGFETAPMLSVVRAGKVIDTFDGTDYFDDPAAMRAELNSFFSNYDSFSNKYIPQNTASIVLALLSAALFLYVFLADFISPNNGVTKLFASIVLDFLLLLLLRKAFQSSIIYYDMTGLSGNFLMGAVSMVASVLCLLTFIKLLCVCRTHKNQN